MRTKLCHVLALSAYILISVIILRSYIFGYGLIEYGDTRFHMKLNIQTEMFSSTWNSYNGFSFIPRGIQWPIYTILSVFGSSLMAQRFLYLTLLTIIQFNMYLALTIMLRNVKIRDGKIKFLTCFVGGLLYLFNPWVVAKIGQWYVLWCYAFIPLIFATFVEGLSALKNPLNTFVSSLIVGVLLFLGTIHWYYVVLHCAFLLMTAVLYILITTIVLRSAHKTLVILRHVVTMVVLSLAIYMVLESYWLVPYALMYRAVKAHWEPIYTPAWVFMRSPSILDSLRLLDPMAVKLYFPWQGIPWLLTSTLISILVFYSLFKLLRNYKKYSHLFNNHYLIVCINAILMVILVFLCKGSKPPFGELYSWILFNSPISPMMNWLLRVSYRLAGYLVFVYTYFLSMLILTTYLDKNLNEVHQDQNRDPKANSKHLILGANLRKSFAHVIAITILISAILTSYPVLNNFQGVILPLIPPKYYDLANRYLSQAYQSHTKYFRVMWLPSTEYPFYLDVKWSPHPELTPDPRIWISSVPVYEYGSSPYYYVMYWFIKNLLEKREFDRIGAILSLLDVRYVIYQQDTINPQKYLRLFQGLSLQKDLRLQRVFGDIFVYENINNLSYAYHSDTIILALCPLDILPTFIKLGLNPLRTPILFLEQKQLNVSTLKHILDNLHAILVICYPKRFNDLILDLLESKYEVHLVRFYKWGIHFLNCPHWIPYYMEKLHNNIKGWHYDLTLNKQILVTTRKDATAEYRFAVDKAGDYIIWMRILRSPRSGKLEVRIDGKKVIILDNRAPWLLGFSWIEIARLKLPKGDHIIELKNLDNGLQAINAIKVVNLHQYEEFKRKILILFKDANVTDIIHVFFTPNGDIAIFRKKDELVLFNASIRLGSFITYGLARAGHTGRLSKPQLSTAIMEGVRGLRITVSENGRYERWSLLLRLNHSIDVTDYSYLYIEFYGNGNGRRFYVRIHSPNGFYTFIFSDWKRGWQQIVIPIKSMEPYKNPTLSNVNGVEISPVGINVSGSWGIAEIGFLKTFNLSRINIRTTAKALSYYHKSGTYTVINVDNISKSVIVFSEAYDSRWIICCRNNCIHTFPINFVEQGAVVNNINSSCGRLIIMYIAEKMFDLGKRITVFAFIIITVVIICLKIKLKTGNVKCSIRRRVIKIV